MLTFFPSTAGDPAILLFGVGLIGRAIADRFRYLGRWSVVEQSTPWNDLHAFVSHCRGAFSRVVLEANRLGISRVEIIWSSGSAGFDASLTETHDELNTFHRFLKELQESGTGDRVTVHLMSSAGGLFEGQRQIGIDSRPHPCRPYGVLKLNQERALRSHSSGFRYNIYRITSAYGLIRSRGRRGLIATMVMSTLAGKEVNIHGLQTTLRDYVAAWDVAAFVVQRCMSPAARPAQTWLLGSGRPTCIYEIAQMVETLLLRPVRLRYSALTTNSADITVYSGALPDRWVATDIRANVAQICRTASAACEFQ